jgi:phosphatidylinositol glycan class B
MQFLHLGDPYLAHTILRVLTAFLNFLFFNYLLLRLFSQDKKPSLVILLLIANFSWSLPYIRTLFTSENFGGLTFFSAVLLYQYFSTRKMTWVKSLLVGGILGLAFFFRFQMAFAMIGLGLWLLFADKASFRTLLGITLGFLILSGLNFLLDSHYYGQWVFTPYKYWEINITLGRAMQNKSFLIYIGMLSSALTAPPLSILYLYHLGKGLYKKLADPYCLSAIFFLLAHCLIPHKEERFVFPLYGILPLILGYGLRDYFNGLSPRFWKTQWSLALKFVVAVSLAINFLLLVLLLFIPVAQHIEFSRKLTRYFQDRETPVKLIFYQRTPYETPSVRKVATYYLLAKNPKVAMETVQDRSAFLNQLRNHEADTYFVSTLDRLKKDNLADEMKCTRLLVSSRFLLGANSLVEKWGGTVLPELWGLYDCREGKSQ